MNHDALATHDGAQRLVQAMNLTSLTGVVVYNSSMYFVYTENTIADPEVTFWEGCEVSYQWAMPNPRGSKEINKLG